MCLGTCLKGFRPDKQNKGQCKKIKNKCELASCDDPEKLKKCHCEENNATVADAKKTCAANACGEDVIACELDYCIGGGDDAVATLYKEAQQNVCEVACEKCEGGGGTCSDCNGATPNCNPTCTYPEKAAVPLWSQSGADYEKCKDGSKHSKVADRAACQAEAVAEGAEWYSLRKRKKAYKCFYSEKCGSVKTETKNS